MSSWPMDPEYSRCQAWRLSSRQSADSDHSARSGVRKGRPDETSRGANPQLTRHPETASSRFEPDSPWIQPARPVRAAVKREALQKGRAKRRSPDAIKRFSSDELYKGEDGGKAADVNFFDDEGGEAPQLPERTSADSRRVWDQGSLRIMTSRGRRRWGHRGSA